jgi:quinol monooxygenase YgiN
MKRQAGESLLAFRVSRLHHGAKAQPALAIRFQRYDHKGEQTMLILAVTIPIKPESHDEAIEIAVRMTAETRKEEGCLAYTFHFPVDDPKTLFVYEEWTSEEALNAHIQSAHMKEFQGRIATVIAGDVAVKRYEV